MRRKVLLTIFRYLYSFQRYSIMQISQVMMWYKNNNKSIYLITIKKFSKADVVVYNKLNLLN